MAKEEWYYLEGRDRMGPVTETEIRKRLVAKLMKPTDMVWREGMDGWTRAGETEEFSEGGKRVHHGGSDDGFQIRADLGVPVVGMVLEMAGKAFGGGFYKRSSRLFVNLGHIAILVSMVFVLLLGLSFTVKGDFGYRGITGGILLVLGLLVAQYVACRFLRACRDGIDDNPSTVTCKPVLDGMAALGLLGALYFVITGVMALINIGFASVMGYHILAVSLTVAAICLCVATLGLNPGVANTEVPDTQRDAGDEALGLIAFLSKGCLALAPVIFGFGSLAITVSLGILVVGMQGDSSFTSLQSMHLARSTEMVTSLFEIVLAPAIFYLFFLAGWLTIRVISATLALPGKVDRVAIALEGPAESKVDSETKVDSEGKGDEGEKDGGDDGEVKDKDKEGKWAEKKP